MLSEPVTLLASGNSLGAYIPAMHAYTYLRSRGVDAEVRVLEAYYREEVRDKIQATRQAFHDNFAAALMGHRLAKPLSAGAVLSGKAAADLTGQWLAAGRRTFVAFTGFWVDILEAYADQAPFPVDIAFLRLDAADTPSYKVYRHLHAKYRQVHLYDAAAGLPAAYLCGIDNAPLRYEERSGRLLVHGGGWGIGTYRDTLQELKEAGYELDVIVYDPSEAGEEDGSTRYYMTEPGWSPWSPGAGGRHTYPPMLQVKRRGTGFELIPLPGYEAYTRLVREAAAIVSKPGGATLNDSLAYAVPLLLLDPFGGHEEANRQYWISCGFGLRYADWKEGGYALPELEACCRRLTGHRKTIKPYGSEEGYAAQNESHVR
ncbi:MULTISPECIES: hypothetical protein [Paenibacillus]|uniref:hypothetical protein n=1 Tax=Paenibacillus TaxID=44249 RepID=UPI0022B91A2D|nr:hypothetical protein [Paenibacillus caseinilyticus]MCZ8520445.1 hypothetical protein [Paenibacillus caseinilyticus]